MISFNTATPSGHHRHTGEKTKAELGNPSCWWCAVSAPVVFMATEPPPCLTPHYPSALGHAHTSKWRHLCPALHDVSSTWQLLAGKREQSLSLLPSCSPPKMRSTSEGYISALLHSSLHHPSLFSSVPLNHPFLPTPSSFSSSSFLSGLKDAGHIGMRELWIDHLPGRLSPAAYNHQ